MVMRRMASAGIRTRAGRTRKPSRRSQLNRIGDADTPTSRFLFASGAPTAQFHSYTYLVKQI